MNNKIENKKMFSMYIWANSLLEIYVYLTMLIGPGFGCDENDIVKGEHISIYFDSLKLTGISISLLEEKDIDNFIQKTNCEKEMGMKKLFFLFGVDKGGVDLKARLEELAIFCKNGYWENNNDIEKIEIKNEIPKNIHEHQRDLLLRCSKALKYNIGTKKAEDTTTSYEDINYHYGLVLNLGFTKGRPFMEVKKIESDNLYLLKELFVFVETKFFNRHKNFWIRAENIGERLNTLSFIYWIYFNLGITKIEEITNEVNLNNLLTSYQDYLKLENLNANTFIKNIKPLILG